MAGDAERLGGAAQHLDLAGLVGLDPDRCVGDADVAEERSQDEVGHDRPVPG